MSDDLEGVWFVCEDGCLYGESAVDRLTSRYCIRHGRVLNDEPALQGLSRAQARKKLDKMRRREHDET